MPTHVNERSVSTLIRSIGMRREDKSRWERRAPLTPEDVKTLIDTTQAKVYVQPSTKRIFRDEEYIKVRRAPQWRPLRLVGACSHHILGWCNTR
jgi:Alanine dehydrogenase/PNT, N-terminal domain